MQKEHEVKYPGRKDLALIAGLRRSASNEMATTEVNQAFLLDKNEILILTTSLRGIVETFYSIIPEELNGLKNNSEYLTVPVSIPSQQELLYHPAKVRESLSRLGENILWDTLPVDSRIIFDTSISRLEELEKFTNQVVLGSNVDNQRASFASKIAAIDQLATEFALNAPIVRNSLLTITAPEEEKVSHKNRERTRIVDEVNLSKLNITPTTDYLEYQQTPRWISNYNPPESKNIWEENENYISSSNVKKPNTLSIFKRSKDNKPKTNDITSIDENLENTDSDEKINLQTPNKDSINPSQSLPGGSSGNVSITSLLNTISRGISNNFSHIQSTPYSQDQRKEKNSFNFESSKIPIISDHTTHSQSSIVLEILSTPTTREYTPSSRFIEKLALPLFGSRIHLKHNRLPIAGRLLMKYASGNINSYSARLAKFIYSDFVPSEREFQREAKAFERREKLYAVQRYVTTTALDGMHQIATGINYITLKPLKYVATKVWNSPRYIKVWAKNNPEKFSNIVNVSLISVCGLSVLALAILPGVILNVFTPLGVIGVSVHKGCSIVVKRREKKLFKLKQIAIADGYKESYIEHLSYKELKNIIFEIRFRKDPDFKRKIQRRNAIISYPQNIARAGCKYALTGGKLVIGTIGSGFVYARNGTVSVAKAIGTGLGTGCRLAARSGANVLNAMKIPIAAKALARLAVRVGRDRETSELDLLNCGGETPGLTTLRALSKGNKITLKRSIRTELEYRPAIFDLYVIADKTGKLIRLKEYLELVNHPIARELESLLFREKFIPSFFNNGSLDKIENDDEGNIPEIYEAEIQCPRGSVGVALPPGTTITEVEFSDITGDRIQTDDLISVIECYLGSAVITVPNGAYQLKYRFKSQSLSEDLSNVNSMLEAILPVIEVPLPSEFTRLSEISNCLRTDVVSRSMVFEDGIANSRNTNLSFDPFFGVLYQTDPERFYELFSQLRTGMPHHIALFNGLMIRKAGFPALIGVGLNTSTGEERDIVYDLEQPSFSIITTNNKDVAWFNALSRGRYYKELFNNQTCNFGHEKRKSIIESIKFEQESRIRTENIRRYKLENKFKGNSIINNDTSSSSNQLWSSSFNFNSNKQNLDELSKFLDEIEETRKIYCQESKWKTFVNQIREYGFNAGKSRIGNEDLREFTVDHRFSIEENDFHGASQAAQVLEYCLDLEAGIQTRIGSTESFKVLERFVKNPTIPELFEENRRILPESVEKQLTQPRYKILYPRDLISRFIGANLKDSYIQREGALYFVLLHMDINSNNYILDDYILELKEKLMIRMSQISDLYSSHHFPEYSDLIKWRNTFLNLSTPIKWSFQNIISIFHHANLSNKNFVTTSTSIYLYDKAKFAVLCSILSYSSSAQKGIHRFLEDAALNGIEDSAALIKASGETILHLTNEILSDSCYRAMLSLDRELFSNVIQSTLQLLHELKYEENDPQLDTAVEECIYNLLEVLQILFSSNRDKALIEFAKFAEISDLQLNSLSNIISQSPLSTAFDPISDNFIGTEKIYSCLTSRFTDSDTALEYQRLIRFFQEINLLPNNPLDSSSIELEILYLNFYKVTNNKINFPSPIFPASTIYAELGLSKIDSQKAVENMKVLINHGVIDINRLEAFSSVSEQTVLKELLKECRLKRVNKDVSLEFSKTIVRKISSSAGLMRLVIGGEPAIDTLITAYACAGNLENIDLAWTSVIDMFPEIIQEARDRWFSSSSIVKVRERVFRALISSGRGKDTFYRCLISGVAQIQSFEGKEGANKIFADIEKLFASNKINKTNVEKVFKKHDPLNVNSAMTKDCSYVERMTGLAVASLISQKIVSVSVLNVLRYPKWIFNQIFHEADESINALSSIWSRLFTGAPKLNESNIDLSPALEESNLILRKLDIGRNNFAQYLDSRSFNSAMVASTVGELSTIREWQPGDRRSQINQRLSVRYSLRRGRDITLVNEYEDEESRGINLIVDLDLLLSDLPSIKGNTNTTLLPIKNGSLTELFFILKAASSEQIPVDLSIIGRGATWNFPFITKRNFSGVPEFLDPLFLSNLAEFLFTAIQYAKFEEEYINAYPQIGFDLFNTECELSNIDNSMIALIHPTNLAKSAPYLFEHRNKGYSVSIFDTREKTSIHSEGVC